jgi:hypothetical protein
MDFALIFANFCYEIIIRPLAPFVDSQSGLADAFKKKSCKEGKKKRLTQRNYDFNYWGKWYSGLTGPEGRWQVVRWRKETGAIRGTLTRRIAFIPAAIKKDAAACQTGRPRIGVRCTTPDNNSVNHFFKEMMYQLYDGFSVNTGWFTVTVHIGGLFHSVKEIFDPKKHPVSFKFHTLKAVKINRIVSNNASRIEFIPIATGYFENRLEIRTRYSGSNIPLSALRTVTSQFVISEI